MRSVGPNKELRKDSLQPHPEFEAEVGAGHVSLYCRIKREMRTHLELLTVIVQTCNIKLLVSVPGLERLIPRFPSLTLQLEILILRLKLLMPGVAGRGILDPELESLYLRL